MAADSGFSLSPSHAQSAATPRLTRDDWLDAAFRAVVNNGFDGVRVLSIADKLGVTRGSFYWHFNDHPDLIDSLVQRWRDRELVISERLKLVATDHPEADLEVLLDSALAHGGTDLENMRFELALRGLGRRDGKVADLLAEVDEGRMKVFEHQFFRLTQDAAKATDLAALFYLTIAGSYQALARPSSTPRIKDYFKEVIRKYLITQQSRT